MPLTAPTSASEVIDRAVNDVFLALQEFNAKPALRNSWLNALIVAYSNRVFDFYFALRKAALEALPDTAVDNLERWAAIWRINRTAGVSSSGNVVVTGTLGATVPAGSLMEAGGGIEYRSRTAVSVTAKNISISSLTRTGSTATATSAGHGLASNVPVTISGAVETEYNVADAEITVVDEDTFTYQISGTPTTPATGTIVGDFESAVIVVDSLTFSDGNDQVLDAELTFQSPAVGIDESANVDSGGLGGGVTQETDAQLRERLLDRIQNPVAQFNVAQITAVAKTVPGVTRVFVNEATPTEGECEIYFMRDNDANPIPNGAEIAEVDAKIQAIRPVNTAEADVDVLAPTGTATAFTFTAISPNTDSMKAAVLANLQQFFAERTTLATNAPEDGYRSAIFNTVDPTTGESLASFTLSAPSGDIVAGAGVIPTLGTVTFP